MGVGGVLLGGAMLGGAPLDELDGELEELDADDGGEGGGGGPARFNLENSGIPSLAGLRLAPAVRSRWPAVPTTLTSLA